jgi:hypothetical protein
MGEEIRGYTVRRKKRGSGVEGHSRQGICKEQFLYDGAWWIPWRMGVLGSEKSVCGPGTLRTLVDGFLLSMLVTLSTEIFDQPEVTFHLCRPCSDFFNFSIPRIRAGLQPQAF